jgi:ubiquinone/menaquinone biosynthesis C-methylase UbiE
MLIFITLLVSIMIIFFSNFLSYRIIKNKLVRMGNWDLNICCGNTDNGRLNADIIKHKDDLNNFVLIKDIYNLPFEDKQFENTLCSHTLEHVEDPKAFFRELKRVSKNVTIIVPPLWDLGAVLNFREHRWIFLTFHKGFLNKLPKFKKLPFSATFQRVFRQRVKA